MLWPLKVGGFDVAAPLVSVLSSVTSHSPEKIILRCLSELKVFNFTVLESLGGGHLFFP